MTDPTTASDPSLVSPASHAAEDDPIAEAFTRRKFSYAFACLDQNGNGILEPGDLFRVAESVRQMLGWSHDEARFQQLHVRMADFWEILEQRTRTVSSGSADLDGFLEFHGELAAEMRASGGQAPAWVLQWVEALLRVLDLNEDGFLSEEEFSNFLYAMGSRMSPAAAFERLDLDRNGLIDLNELHVLVAQYLTSTSPEDPGNYLLTGGWPG